MKSALTALIFTLSFAFAAMAADAKDVYPTKLEGLNLASGKDQSVSLSPTKKAMVVSFLSAKCPCSDSHVQALKSLKNEFPEIEFVAVHSNADEDEALSKTYFSKAAMGFPVLQDKELHLADAYGAYKTPHVFVVNPDGKILYRGGVSDSKDFARAKTNFLKDALTDIKAGQLVRMAEGRTLGCAINRGEQHLWR